MRCACAARALELRELPVTEAAVARAAKVDDRALAGDAAGWLTERRPPRYRGPQESRGLRWGHFQEHTSSSTPGRRAGTAPNPRTLRLLAQLAQDLREWRLASGRPADGSEKFGAAE